MTGVLPAELFDQMARPAAYMVAGSLMWLNLLLVGMAFPFIVGNLGQFCFLPFCGICVLACLFMYWNLPETKGRSLAEITAEFDKRGSAEANGSEGRSLAEITAEFDKCGSAEAKGSEDKGEQGQSNQEEAHQLRDLRSGEEPVEINHVHV